MASFTEKDVPKGDWVLVASAVTGGTISKIIDDAIYRYKGTVAGAGKPEKSVEGVAWISQELDLTSSTGAIDVYLFTSNKDGKVEVML